MGLIKSANTPASLSPFSMRDIEMHAKSILLRAQQQADQLLSAAQMEAVSLKEQARIEGLQEGKQAGTVRGLKEGNAAGQAQALQEHRAALTAAVTALGGAMQELDVSRRALESEALTDVIELAVSIARRVTKRQAMFDPQVLIDN
jgi:flagellar biosynthesis/type III secretory pathway protein FliH